MDYLFVAGKSGTTVANGGAVLSRRAPLTRLVPLSVTILTIEQFLEEVNVIAPSTPIGDLLIIAHARATIGVNAYLDAEHLAKWKTVGPAIYYEHLDDADRSNSIRLPVDLLTDTNTGV